MRNSLIGDFPVRTDTPALVAFRAALGARGRDGNPVPYTFPIAWMNAPSVRSAIERHLVARDVRPGAILMHLAQAVSYQRVLAPDSDYMVNVHLTIEEGNERICLETSVVDALGQEICRLESRIALLWPEDGS